MPKLKQRDYITCRQVVMMFLPQAEFVHKYGQKLECGLGLDGDLGC